MEENKFEGQAKEDQLEGKIEFSSEESAEEIKIDPPAPAAMSNEEMERAINKIKEGNLSGNPIDAPMPAVKYAGFWVRWAAYFIDGIIISIIFFPINIFFSLVLGFSLDSSNLASFISAMFGLTISWGYHIFMINNYQATLGKMALGIKVASGDLNKLPIGKIVLRETIGKIVSAVILYIGYIMVAFTDRKRALHDIMADSVVIYKDPNKKSNTGVIVAIIVVFVFITIAIVGILASIVLVSLNSAKEKSSEMAVISLVQSTQIGVILCADEGLKINSPSNGANICNSKDGNFIWGDLSERGASWGGCQEELDLSDNEFKYCATTSSGKIITCTSDGCVFEGEESSLSAPLEEAKITNNESNATTEEPKESEFEIVLVGVIKNLDTETGAGSNIYAASSSLDKDDLAGARQQFIWAKEKIVEAQSNLKSVTPLENEKASYDKIDNMLNEYIRGLDTIVSGIDKGNETLMLEGINIIKETSQSAAVGA